MIDYLGEVEKVKKARLWNDMNTRCYNDKLHERFTSYIGCEVCPEWKNDKNEFYQWVEENYYTVGDEQMDLDKDILVKGNKIYSPDTCVFVPHSINTLFVNCKKNRGELPIGVYYDKDRKKYRASFSINGNVIRLSRCDTPEEAFEEYKRHKKAAIIAMADRYKGSIPEHLYNAMIAWEIEETD